MNVPDVFKAYDIRGVSGEQLTPELCEAIGQALSLQLGEGIVAVGRDMRPESAHYAEGIIRGLVAQGREVWDISLVPSDMIYFAVGQYKLAGGAMVTASHNPGKYDGIKLLGAGALSIGLDNGLGEIRDRIARDFEPAGTPGTVIKKDLKAEWLSHALSFVNPSSWPAYKVAIDAGNGMAGAVLPDLLPRLPLQVTPLYFELDGSFPHHLPNPVDPTNLQDLATAIKEGQLDFGIAFDGDGDRAILVDKLGRQVDGSILSAMIAEHILIDNPGATILYAATCSRVVLDTINKAGGQPSRTKVGHTNLEMAMRKDHALFGGEQSGHLYFRDNFNASSGLITALMAIEAIAASGKTLEELVDQYSPYARSGEINVETAVAGEIMRKLKDHFNDGGQDDLDGLTVAYRDWWFNARASNTEPLLRINIEADDSMILAAKKAEVLALVKN